MKIEIQLTPDEFKELYLPSEKQAEFASKAAKAYIDAITKIASAAVSETVETVGKKFKKDQY